MGFFLQIVSNQPIPTSISLLAFLFYLSYRHGLTL